MKRDNLIPYWKRKQNREVKSKRETPHKDWIEIIRSWNKGIWLRIP